MVLGSANADIVVKVNRRPSAGETVLGSDTEILPGGKGANTAVAAGRLGADVALVAAIGDDSYGDLLMSSLRDAGVDTGPVHRVDRATGIAFIMVTPDGENSILVSPGANSTLSTTHVEEGLGHPRVVVASIEVPVATVEHAISLASARGARTVLNLSPVAKLSAATLSTLDPLIVNEHEAAWLLGGDAVRPRELLALGPRSVVITLGARGALVASSAGVHEIPAPPVDPVDTTGAGDAFTGALAATLATGADLVDAARFAVRVAAASVTRRGAQPSYPTAEELAGGGS